MLPEMEKEFMKINSMSKEKVTEIMKAINQARLLVEEPEEISPVNNLNDTYTERKVKSQEFKENKDGGNEGGKLWKLKLPHKEIPNKFASLVSSHKDRENEDEILLPSQNKIKHINMPYLPKNDSVNLPFLKTILESIKKLENIDDDDISSQNEKKFPDMFYSPINNNEQLLLENIESFFEKSEHNGKDMEKHLQNGKKAAKTSSRNEERQCVDMSYLPNNENFDEMSFIQSVNESIKKSKLKERGGAIEKDKQFLEKATQTSPRNKEKYVDMLYLPKIEDSDMSFIQSVQASIEKSKQNEKDAVENGLEHVKAINTSLQDEDVKNSSQNGKATELSMQNEPEAIEVTSVHNGKPFEMYPQNKKVEEMSSLDDVYEVDIPLQSIVENLCSKNKLVDAENNQKDRETEVYKTLHQQSVRKMIPLFQKTVGYFNYPNKEGTVGEPNPKKKINLDELKLEDKEEISGHCTTQLNHGPDLDEICEAIACILLERID